MFWGYGADALPYITIDVPTNVLEARDEVVAAAALWSDERSLREYVNQVRWRLSADFAALSPAEPNQYFADGVVRVGTDEVFVDCGAFTGDTLRDVAKRVGSWRAYHAFEPDPASFAALQAVVATLPEPLAGRVHLHRAAASDRPGTARFNATGLGSAALSMAGGYQVDCVAIDEVLTELPTFVKMDIEGAEAAALAGSGRMIREGRPLLAVAAYHKQADLSGAAAPCARHGAGLPNVPAPTRRRRFRRGALCDAARQAAGRLRRPRLFAVETGPGQSKLMRSFSTTRAVACGPVWIEPILAQHPDEEAAAGAEEVDADQQRRQAQLQSFQNRSLATKYPRATSRLSTEMVNPQ